MNDEVQEGRAGVPVHHSSLALRTSLLVLIVLFVACETVEVRFPWTIRGDETLYIQAANTMIKTGDWLTPRTETDELRFNKPILTYWVVGIPMSLFGLSLSAARRHCRSSTAWRACSCATAPPRSSRWRLT
jgi:hypothetical protein